MTTARNIKRSRNNRADLLGARPGKAALVFCATAVRLTQFGERLRRMGLLLIPEEQTPPSILVRANELTAASGDALDCAIARLVHDADFRQAHMQMLGSPPLRSKGDIDVPLVVALTKIAEATDAEDALAMMSRQEIFAVLANRAALLRLIEKNVSAQTRPTGEIRFAQR